MTAVADVIRPTWFATPRAPLLAVTAALAGIGVVVSRHADAAPAALVVVASASIVACLVLGLDDQAAQIVTPLPTSAGWRLTLRLVVLAPVAAAMCAVLLLADRLLFDVAAPAPRASALIALAAGGVAVDVLVARRRPDVSAEIGAGAVMLWVLIGAIPFVPDAVTALWIDHPLPALAAALTLIAIGTRGRQA